MQALGFVISLLLLSIMFIAVLSIYVYKLHRLVDELLGNNIVLNARIDRIDRFVGKKQEEEYFSCNDKLLSS